MASVLSGEASYDDLDTASQSVVRTMWRQGIAEDIDRLDIPAELCAQGVSWSTCDERGRVIIVHPDGTHEYQDGVS